MARTTLTFTTLSLLTGGTEDTEKTITFADLTTAGNEADTSTAFVVQAVSTGTLRIGLNATDATAFDASTNATIDATHFAYWTSESNANGNLNAFTLVAKDSGGGVSVTPPVQAVVAVTAVNDAPSLISGTELALGNVNLYIDAASLPINSLYFHPSMLAQLAINAQSDVQGTKFAIRVFFLGAMNSEIIIPITTGTAVPTGITTNFMYGFGQEAAGGTNEFLFVSAASTSTLPTAHFSSVGGIEDKVYAGYELDAGKFLLLAGSSKTLRGDTDFALIKIDIDNYGTLATNFGENGKVILPISLGDDVVNSITTDSQGRILLIGSSIENGQSVATLVRLSASGILDTSFGTKGKMTFAQAGETASYGRVVTVNEAGNIFFALATKDSVGHVAGIIMSLTNGGQIDPSFGINGKTVLFILDNDVYINQLIANPNDYKNSFSYSQPNELFIMATTNSADGLLHALEGRVTFDGDITNFSQVPILPKKAHKLGYDIHIGANGQIQVSDLTVHYRIGDNPIVLNPAFTVTDTELDATSYLNATMTLARHGGANADDVFSASVFDGSNIVVSGTTIGTFTNSTGALVLTFNSDATQFRVNSAIQAIAYSNSNNNSPATTQIDWTFNDGNTASAQGSGGALTVLHSSSVNITTSNTTPVIADLNTDSTNFTLNTPEYVDSQETTGAASITDADGNLNGGYILVHQTAGTADGAFSFDGSTITSGGNAVIVAGESVVNTTGSTTLGTIDSTSGTPLDGQNGHDLKINLASSVAAVDADSLIYNILQFLQYTAPTAGARTFDVTVNDGAATSLVSTFTMTGLDIVAPTVTSIVHQTPIDTTTDADSLVYRVTFSEAVSNLDAADFSRSGTTGTIASATRVGSTNAYDITVSGGNLASLNGDVSLSFASGQTITDLGNNALSNVTPTGTDNHIYTLANANTAPIWTGLDGTPIFTEGSTAVIFDSNVQLTDAELSNSGIYTGSTLTLARTGGANGNDVFTSTVFSGSNIVVSSTTIGTITTNSAGTLVLTFNASATGSLVNSAMQAIKYSNSNKLPDATAQIDWTFNDANTTGASNGALSVTGSTTVNITAVNELPTISDVPSSATDVVAGVAVDLADFTVADINVGDTLTVTLTTTNGTIGGVVDMWDDAGIQIIGTESEINAKLAAATFTATKAFAASVNISVTDGHISLPVTEIYPFTVSANPEVITSVDDATTVLVSPATADSTDWWLSSAKTNNVIFGTKFAETFHFKGAGNANIIDVSNGDKLILDAATTLSGNTVSIKNEGNDVVVSSVGTYRLGGLNLDETVTVGFDDNTFAVSRLGSGFSYVTNANSTIKHSIVGSTAADLITGGARVDTITGGNGADTIDGGAGADKYIISATSQTGVVPETWSANLTIDTTNMDVYTMGNGDTLDLSAIASTLATITAVTSTVTASTAFITAGTGTAAQSFKGTYADNTFTSNINGTATLLVYDNNGSDEGGANEGVVLVGVTAVGVTAGVFYENDG